MKRIRKDNKGFSWGISIFTLLLALFGIACLYENGFEAFTFIMWSFLLIVFGWFSISVITESEIVETLRFTIYSYEKWNMKTSAYRTYYIVTPTHLKAKFIFHYHIRDYIDTMNEVDINKYIKKLINEEFNHWYGYESKDKAMEYIVEYVKTILQNRKTNANVDYKNIKFSENIDVKELIKTIESYPIQK